MHVCPASGHVPRVNLPSQEHQRSGSVPGLKQYWSDHFQIYFQFSHAHTININVKDSPPSVLLMQSPLFTSFLLIANRRRLTWNHTCKQARAIFSCYSLHQSMPHKTPFWLQENFFTNDLHQPLHGMTTQDNVEGCTLLLTENRVLLNNCVLVTTFVFQSALQSCQWLFTLSNPK